MRNRTKKNIISMILVLSLVFIFAGCGTKVATEQVENLELVISMSADQEIGGLYTGEVVENIPNGEGTFSPTNADVYEWYYEGEFKDGMFNGQGTITYVSGMNYVGTFEDNILVNGEYRDDSNFLYYEGDFGENFTFEGEGKIYDYAGEIQYEGTFEDSKPVDVKALDKSVVDITYDELLATKYDNGIVIKVIGEVLEVLDDESYTAYIIAQKNYPNEIYVFGDYSGGDATIKVGNTVTAYGSYDGFTADPECEAGGRKNIPYITTWNVSVN